MNEGARTYVWASDTPDHFALKPNRLEQKPHRFWLKPNRFRFKTHRFSRFVESFDTAFECAGDQVETDVETVFESLLEAVMNRVRRCSDRELRIDLDTLRLIWKIAALHFMKFVPNRAFRAKLLTCRSIRLSLVGNSHAWKGEMSYAN